MEKLIEQEFKKLVNNDPEVVWKTFIIAIFKMMSSTDEKKKCDDTCKYFDEGGPCINCRRNHQDDLYEAK